MKNFSVVAPTIGATVAFAAALDAYYRVGAVDWVIDLCFSDPDAASTTGMGKDMPEVPMKHTGHALLYASVGSALASSACVAKWLQDKSGDLDPEIPSREGQFALIAALAMLANTGTRKPNREVMDMYAILTDDTLSDEGAAAAVDYFTPEALDEAPEIFGALTRKIDREMVICGALCAARSWPNPTRTIETVGAIADAMDMTGSEINEIWEAYINDDPGTETEPVTHTSLPKLWIGELSKSIRNPSRIFAPVMPKPVLAEAKAVSA